MPNQFPIFNDKVRITTGDFVISGSTITLKKLTGVKSAQQITTGLYAFTMSKGSPTNEGVFHEFSILNQTASLSMSDIRAVSWDLRALVPTLTFEFVSGSTSTAPARVNPPTAVTGSVLLTTKVNRS